MRWEQCLVHLLEPILFGHKLGIEPDLRFCSCFQMQKTDLKVSFRCRHTRISRISCWSVGPWDGIFEFGIDTDLLDTWSPQLYDVQDCKISAPSFFFEEGGCALHGMKM